MKRAKKSVVKVQGFDLEGMLVSVLGVEYKKTLTTAGVLGVVGLIFAPAIKNFVKMLNNRISKLFKDEDYD